MTGRHYYRFLFLGESILFLAALAIFAYEQDAHAICSALLIVAFVLSLHVPESWRNARARAHRDQAQPATGSTPDFPEQPRRGIR
ncbi:hypothetical protein Xgly_03380 [Xanthomonas citri pv. glycines]|uniref:hypothetical protein n=1 Tax=Xanthomonas TaxID=338 RepID=UPI0004A44D87|nr:MULTISPECIES: hypothetical protein [Xanthomonas]OOW99249.1 hypothetical protein Xgly_03380 [Xanthomonas citri pv. glycines]PPU60007.1 hypothetical protein XacyCFBP1159_13180 [Xanthomonas arboricola pv. corylina]QTK36110.1 hypothetical protein XcgCFBP2526_07945 [Xanthomonas citri pv. glycines CFBP 2526]UIX76523.1 hypothetical protein LMJ37_02690 [Xanthomonas citri pv. glycines]